MDSTMTTWLCGYILWRGGGGGGVMTCVCKKIFQCGQSTTATSRHCCDMTSDVKRTLNPNKQTDHLIKFKKLLNNTNWFFQKCNSSLLHYWVNRAILIYMYKQNPPWKWTKTSNQYNIQIKELSYVNIQHSHTLFFQSNIHANKE